VRLSFVSPPPEDAFYEVWLMDSGAERLVSLGPVSDRGLYPLPEGLDPDTLPVVDVSLEPLDGDPAHSGDSLVRGTLPI
jgi:Anti-sigma-K factor rskA